MPAPEVMKCQNAVGIAPGGSAPRAEFVRFIREDKARWTKIIKGANIKME